MKKTALILTCILGSSFSLMANADVNNTTQQATPPAQQATPPAQQATPPAQQATPPTQSAATVSDSDLNKFAKAHKEVIQIQQKYQEKLQGNQSQQASQEVQQKAYNEMTKAVESNGLTTQQYTEIAQKVQQSPQLQQKIQDMQ